jgi:cellulose synthase (UDP-forming)
MAIGKIDVGKIKHSKNQEIFIEKTSTFEKIVLITLITLALESVIYFSHWWFFGDHRKQIFFFVVLSFAIFWEIFRNLINWYIYSFIKVLPKTKLKKKFSVDVLTTAMPGEPYEMFEKTLTAITKIEYPHNTYLLDGGNDKKLKKLCEKLDTRHINCQEVEGAKAGKINYCLNNFSKSEMVLIIDPDHIPQKDFFEKTLPYFEDEKIGFVQVVQVYHNANENFVSYAAAEQTFGFYGPTLMGLNGLGIPTAIGANCTFRRKALDSVGGHAIHLAEDALTSMRIHAENWKSVYVPYRGSSGLVPADLGSFFKQQLKWATGMFYLLFQEYPKLFRKFNFVAKLHYFFAGTFYLNGLAIFFTLLLPIIFLFFQIYAVEMSLTDFLIHYLPYIGISTGINIFIQRWYSHRGEKGFPWKSMVLEKGTWHIYLLGLAYGLSGKKVAYLPTPKTAQEGVFLNLVVPHIVLLVLSFFAIIFALTTYHRIDTGTNLMIFFASINILLLTPTIWIGIKNMFVRSK